MGNAKPGMRFCVQGIGPSPGLIKNAPSKGNILYDLHDPVVIYFHRITPADFKISTNGHATIL